MREAMSVSYNYVYLRTVCIYGQYTLNIYHVYTVIGRLHTGEKSNMTKPCNITYNYNSRPIIDIWDYYTWNAVEFAYQ